ncbi:hypothetical protein [Vibrio anguillarum]|uniref:Uncharacterized protein n=1 Tax=Vibrio anguillarum TaxID=55601 RepID=A0A7U6FS08_VIBAN|nr:hypothetical protein [Vibrio anguillarum]AZS26260.1 hypothetical protein DYL72_15235 [Vibrio anguillarum]MBF4374541.1 hypothetical protein [Vibrio anguillarum]
MKLEEAKQKLIENAQGYGGYEAIKTWSELAAKASFEQDEALFKAEKLKDLVSIARDKAEIEQDRIAAEGAAALRSYQPNIKDKSTLNPYKAGTDEYDIWLGGYKAEAENNGSNY